MLTHSLEVVKLLNELISDFIVFNKEETFKTILYILYAFVTVVLTQLVRSNGNKT